MSKEIMHHVNNKEHSSTTNSKCLGTMIKLFPLIEPCLSDANVVVLF